ncbi:hypothetical protein [Chryseobacterium sp. JUb7]|uniref:hypothetical protein n=1 Tax=Chryseobacterium sp. JUb7 TaxID=2940599 RepID=UPI002167BADB|nr:hypothetical protein [Chryseobacterium sp. JUb7]MCS3532207.1 hypothetical protein [Chryseobacterium sp. JUb7]
MKKSTFLMSISSMALSFSLNAQVGINNPNPQASLDVIGKPTVTSSLDGIIPPRITGDQLRAKTYTAAQTGAQVYVTAADSNPSGQTIGVKAPGNYYFDGTVWKHIVDTVSALPNGTGSVIMINGVLQVAQEMTMRMSQDWVVPLGTGNPSATTNRSAIGNITTELVDNYNSYTGTTTTNSFKVTNDGTYQIGMNFPIQNQNGNVLNGNFYYGVFNVTDNKWQVFTIYTVNDMNNGDVKIMNYLGAVDLVASKTYAFYAGQQQPNFTGSNGANLLIRGLSVGVNGNFELGYFSVKRIK